MKALLSELTPVHKAQSIVGTWKKKKFNKQKVLLTYKGPKSISVDLAQS